MQVNAKQIDSVNAAASVKISANAIKNEVSKLAIKASKTIKMDGFRVGKVPVAAVLKRYEKELSNDAEQNLFKEAINLALKELKKEAKDVVGEPYFEKFERVDGGVEAELSISFKPEVKLDGYEKFIPKYEPIKVSKDELNERKNELLKRHAVPEAIKEKRGLKKGDLAKFDFEGFVDDKAFDGGKAENYVLEIGSGQFIPGFEDGMLDLKAGEQKDVKVTFPKEYGAAHLAGKDAIFKVKLHEIQALKMPEINEELLKKILPGEEKVSEKLFEEKLEEQIKNEKLIKLINEELKGKFADALVQNYNFDLPKGIVEQETDMQFRAAWGDFSEEERKEFAENAEKAKEKRDSFKDEAIKSVKLTFIVDELARLRNLSVNDQEILQAVYFEAYRYGIEPKEHLENYKKQGALPAVRMAILEEKLFNDIFLPKQEVKEEKAKKTAKKAEKSE